MFFSGATPMTILCHLGLVALLEDGINLTLSAVLIKLGGLFSLSGMILSHAKKDWAESDYFTCFVSTTCTAFRNKFFFNKVTSIIYFQIEVFQGYYWLFQNFFYSFRSTFSKILSHGLESVRLPCSGSLVTV